MKIEKYLGKAWKSFKAQKFLGLEIYEYIAFSAPRNSLKEKNIYYWLKNIIN